MEKDEIIEKRGNLILKSNEMILKSSYNLDLQESRIVHLLISLIKPSNQQFESVKFNINDFARLCGFKRGGKTNALIKSSLDKLMSKRLKYDKGKEIIKCHWIESTRENRETHDITLRLSVELKDFLLNLKGNYTSYELNWILGMKNKYSYRLLEILKAFNLPFVRITLEKLKELLECEKYEFYANFKLKVLNKSIEEINNNTSINVSMEEIKDGKRVVKLKFNILKKTDEERLKISIRQNKEIEDFLNINYKLTKDVPCLSI